MNVFWIPSWYPVPENPAFGTFIHTQAQALTRHYPDVQLGISLWGQGQAAYQLWAQQPLASFQKWRHWRNGATFQVRHPRLNWWEMETPVAVWSRRWREGNFAEVLRVNTQQALYFARQVGKIDLVHAHVGHPAGRIARYLAQELGCPYLITEQMSPFPFAAIWKKNRLHPAYAPVYAQAALNLAISPSLAQHMQACGIQKIRVVPNPVDESFFYPQEGDVGQSFTFFSLGRMEAQKGFPDLLYAFREVQRRQPEVRLRIGGEGSQKKKYQQMAKQLGLAKQVEWLGFLTPEEARQEYQRCQAFVLASHHETLGVVWIEALACGKPIIATRCGGPVSIVNPGNGLLADVGDIPGLAKAMEEIMTKRDEFSSERIRADFLKRFSTKVIAQQIRQAYETIL